MPSRAEASRMSHHRTHVRWLLAAASLAALVAYAAAGAQPSAIRGTCSVQFFATSTLHDFGGEAPCAVVAVEPPDASGRYAARAEVAIAQMTTGIAARDRRMREMFEAKKFPRVVVRCSGIDPSTVRARRAGALPCELAIHGVTHPVSPRLASYAEVDAKSASFEASFDVSLAQFGLEAPVVMGFVRVGDRVRVVARAELTAGAENGEGGGRSSDSSARGVARGRKNGGTSPRYPY
jgi:hypothetical protein